MKVIVIIEIDRTYNEETVIGVADSIENAEKLISEYYGDYTEVSRNDIKNSSIEYIKVIDVDVVEDGISIQNTYSLVLEWFTLNES